MLIIISFSSIFIMLLMFFWMKILSFKTKNNREKISPYECGFDPFNSPRIYFSFSFFIISVLFILFDIEVALLLPILKTWNIFNYMYINNSWMFIVSMFIMTSGLEWTLSMIYFK
uniref:NADH dehydrogenase subunit 3 n=1 Tax=Ammophila clavus TaxID=2594619 RepID=UPI00300222C9